MPSGRHIQCTPVRGRAGACRCRNRQRTPDVAAAFCSQGEVSKASGNGDGGAAGGVARDTAGGTGILSRPRRCHRALSCCSCCRPSRPSPYWPCPSPRRRARPALCAVSRLCRSTSSTADLQQGWRELKAAASHLRWKAAPGCDQRDSERAQGSRAVATSHADGGRAA